MHSMKKRIVSLTMVGALAAGFAVTPVQPVFADDPGTPAGNQEEQESQVGVQFPGLKADTGAYSIFISGLKKGNVVRAYLQHPGGEAKMIKEEAMTEDESLHDFQLTFGKNGDGDALLSGDQLSVKVFADKDLESELTTSEQATYVDNIKNRPAKMTTDPASLVRDKEKQTVAVHFDKDYEAQEGDELKLTAYTKDGYKLEDDAANKASSKVSLSKHSMDLTITPVKGAAYYTVEFASKGTVVADLTQKLTIGADFSEATELVLDYGKTTVKPGEKVTPKVYLKNKDGDTLDVSDRATFSYDGDAIEEKDREKGGFTVKADKKYIGETIRVTAVDGTRAVTRTLTVKEDEQAASKTSIVLTINSKDMLVNEEKVIIDAPAVIKNSRTFVPLRAVTEAFGAKVSFDDAARVVTIELGKDVVKMPIGSKVYTVNGKSMTMDVAPYIQPGVERTMLPARFAAEPFGFTADFTKNPDGTVANVMFKN